jgi:hypothetical protein
MSLPLKNRPHPVDPGESPGPKVVPIQAYDPDIDSEAFAAAEVEFVVEQATAALADTAKPFHELGERIVCAYDMAMQNLAASARHRARTLRNLAEKDPVRFMAVIAGAAFVAGFSLRIWRASRA